MQVVVDFGEACVCRFLAFGAERFSEAFAFDLKDDAVPTVSCFEVCHG